MPIHFNDLDVAKQSEGLHSALIIPCYMCPAVTLAARENRPFIQLLSHFLKSPPFEHYIKELQSALKRRGVEAKVFKSRFVHQWFMCMWPSARRKKLKREIHKYDAAIILGCDSATETVRELVETEDCKVVQGMEAVGFMNAKMVFHWPCDVSFEDCKIVPIKPEGNREMI